MTKHTFSNYIANKNTALIYTNDYLRLLNRHHSVIGTLGKYYVTQVLHGERKAIDYLIEGTMQEANAKKMIENLLVYAVKDGVWRPINALNILDYYSSQISTQFPNRMTFENMGTALSSVTSIVSAQDNGWVVFSINNSVLPEVSIVNPTVKLVNYFRKRAIENPKGKNNQ